MLVFRQTNLDGALGACPRLIIQIHHGNYMLKNRFRWLILLCLMASPLYASSIKSVSVSEVANSSALIFEGRVTASRVVQQPGSRAIHTLITFEVLDVLKGDYAEPNIELSFLGGSKGEITMHVTDLNRPGVGDRGIYFVENPSRSQVNPFYGWDQGHYKLKYQPDLGQMAVVTHNGKSIYGVDDKAVAGVSALSHGVARGVRLSAIADDKPLTPAQFKQQVRGMLR